MGSGTVQFERALVSSYFLTSYGPSIIHGNVRTYVSYNLYTFQRCCCFCAPARYFSHPTSSLPKSPHVPLEIDECPLVYEEWRCWATCPCNQFPRFPTYVFLIQQRHRQMEGRTDRQTYGHHTIAMPCYAL